MAGHSKWANIKRKKAANDAKRGQLFTKLLREIQIAAKHGGGNVDHNIRLKTAVATAKSQSVPNDNIDKAIKRGTGDMEGVDYEEVVYEGYGPGGVALLIKTLTDNKNRTVAEIRHALTRCNGSLASTNSVAYQFNDRGVISVKKEDGEEESLFELAIDAGAEDVVDEEDVWEVLTDPKELHAVGAALEEAGIKSECELRSVPDSTIEVAGKDAQTLIKLLEMLEDLDDVQNVTANFEMDDSELAAMSSE